MKVDDCFILPFMLSP